MSVTCTPYTTFEKKMLNLADSIDFDSADLRLAICTSSYTPNRDTHAFFSDVTNELATAGGYTAGGALLTGVTVGLDTTGHFSYIDADDVVWPTATLTGRILVLYHDTGTPATSPLIGWIDNGANFSPAGVDLTVSWAAPASGGVVKVG